MNIKRGFASGTAQVSATWTDEDLVDHHDCAVGSDVKQQGLMKGQVRSAV